MNGKAPIDVVSDNVTDACQRLNCTPHELFVKAAQGSRNGQGFSNADEVGQSWYRTWLRDGYRALSPVAKDFILEANEQRYSYMQLPVPTLMSVMLGR